MFGKAMEHPRSAYSLILLVCCAAICPRVLPAAPPNVVVVLADDLGYGDVKSFGLGRCQIDTPHFDRLAREGMRFTNAYAIASVCVPSRMSIMTGRYAFRFGRPVQGGSWGFLGTRLKTNQFTLARMFRSRGYRTGYVGKWHLGTLMTTTDDKVQGLKNVDYTRPLKIGAPQYGFDTSFILPGSLDMYPYVFARNNHWIGKVTTTKGWSAFGRMGPAAEDFEDVKVLKTFGDEAQKFIAASRNKPFFLFVALTAPHTPTSPSKEFEGKSRIGLYGDFVMNTDHTLGRVLAALDRAGVADDTLVIAASDHGPAPYAGAKRVATYLQIKELEKQGHFASGPFRGYKFSIYEGAFRVPFVVRWPGVVKATKSCDQTIGLIDLMATLGEVTGADITDSQRPDSISFLPLLKDAQFSGSRGSIFLQGTHGNAFREGDWKIAFCPGSGAMGKWGNTPIPAKAWSAAVQTHGRNPKSHKELAQAPFVQLFNLAQDPGEANNLAGKHPERVTEMVAAAQRLIDRGRSTRGPALENDRKSVLFKSVPKSVWGK